MSCSINLKGISYKREEEVFENIILNIGHQEKVAIVGENGCGKTTLLKIVAGIEKPSSGDLFLFHEKIETKKDLKTLRENIGFLQQDVDDHFLCPTVIEDVMFSLRAKGQEEREAQKKAEQALKSLGVIHLANRNVFDLSGGEKKIVALAGILVLEPKILLLDEPTNALDEKAQKRLIEILKSIKKSMIIVSHHKEFIEELAPTMYLLEKRGLEKIEG